MNHGNDLVMACRPGQTVQSFAATRAAALPWLAYSRAAPAPDPDPTRPQVAGTRFASNSNAFPPPREPELRRFHTGTVVVSIALQ